MRKKIKRLASMLLVFSMLGTVSPLSAVAINDADVIDGESIGSSDAVTNNNAVNSNATGDNAASNNAADSSAADNIETDDNVTDNEIDNNTTDNETDTTTGSNEKDVKDEETESSQEENEIALFASRAAHDIYVANSQSGGSNLDGDGTREKPFLKMSKAIETAKTNNYDSLNIILLSDIGLTQEFVLDDPNMPVSVTSENGTHKIQFTGSSAIGSESGLIKAVNGAHVSFDGVNLAGSTGTYEGRVIYVSNEAVVDLNAVTISDGRSNNVLTNKGGAGAFVEDKGTLNIGNDTVFENNKAQAGGGAIFVADGGTVNITDNAAIRNNTAKMGAGIYADTQTKSYGGLNISDTVTIAENIASENGSGIYVCENAKAVAKGNVVVNDNIKASAQNNVYLCDKATLDISGTTVSANIGITCDTEYAYRRVSLPQSYAIVPTENGDEKGWHDDCGTWDIRYMNYNGVPGMYLYYKTLDVTFEDINTLTSITGKDINAETVDFLNDTLPCVTKDGGVLTAADIAAKNIPEDDDLTYTFTVDKDVYRIPTAKVVKVTSGGKNVPFTYEPDFETGKATISIDDEVVDTLTDTIKFEISGEKYYDLTVRMEGPLYSMTSSITGLSKAPLVISEENKAGTTAHYKLTLGGEPAEGVVIELYEEGSDALGGTLTTDSDGGAATRCCK